MVTIGLMSITGLITFAEFERLPETPGKQELIDGELIAMPPPELSHTELMKLVYDLLRSSLHPASGQITPATALAD